MIEERVKKGTKKKNRRYNFTTFEKKSIFFYRNFYAYEQYKSMYPHSNQPAK